MGKTHTNGVHHVGLTVPDLKAAKSFFIDLLGYKQVGEKKDYPAVFVSDGVTMITLWQVTDPNTAVAFDRKNVVGLHHMALKVESAKALNDMNAALKSAEGVEIEFSPEPLGGGPTKHMMCRMPGGIRLEFIAPSN